MFNTLEVEQCLVKISNKNTAAMPIDAVLMTVNRYLSIGFHLKGLRRNFECCFNPLMSKNGRSHSLKILQHLLQDS